MLAKERLAHILKCLQINQSISIHALSEQMHVSFSTVQRDLAQLEREGKIDRTRGGAISNHISNILSGKNEVAVAEKINIHIKEKQAIAKKAATLIHDGDCVFLDSGTTIAHLIPFIAHLKITIVTNSLYLQRSLKGCAATVYLIGGTYNFKHDMSIGSATIAQIENMRFDSAFLSASGVDLSTQELYAVELDIAEIKKMVIKRSSKCYVLADSTKFAVKALYTYAKFLDVAKIYTDNKLSKAEKNNQIIVCN